MRWVLVYVICMTYALAGVVVTLCIEDHRETEYNKETERLNRIRNGNTNYNVRKGN